MTDLRKLPHGNVVRKIRVATQSMAAGQAKTPQEVWKQAWNGYGAKVLKKLLAQQSQKLIEAIKDNPNNERRTAALRTDAQKLQSWPVSSSMSLEDMGRLWDFLQRWDRFLLWDIKLVQKQWEDIKNGKPMYIPGAGETHKPNIMNFPPP